MVRQPQDPGRPKSLGSKPSQKLHTPIIKHLLLSPPRERNAPFGSEEKVEKATHLVETGDPPSPTPLVGIAWGLRRRKRFFEKKKITVGPADGLAGGVPTGAMTSQMKSLSVLFQS